MTAPIVDETTGELLLDPTLDPDGPREILDGEAECRRCDYERRRADAERNRAEGIKVDYENRDQEARALHRQVNTLKAELEKQRTENPSFATARAIFHRWVEESGRNPKRTRFTEKRQKAVLARLNEYDDEFVMWGVVGGVRAANVSQKETQRLALIATMEKAVRLLEDQGGDAAQLRDFYREQVRDVVKYDDLELICRDGIPLERGHAAAVRMGLVEDV